MKVDHQSIVKILGLLQQETNTFSMIMEYMCHGSVCDFFRKRENKHLLSPDLQWPVKVRIAFQVSLFF